MSFSINTRDLPRLSTYEQAHEWFNTVHNPVRSKKWLSYQRPLRNTQSTHLRIEHHFVNGVDCYDLCLYNTPLVRLFKPNEQGERAVWMQNHYSTSSASFMYTMCWHNRMTLQTTEGVNFPLFISDQSGVAVKLWDDPFTCKIVLNSEGKVIADKSVYIPAMRKSSSATHRAKRKALRDHMSMVFDMLEMQYSSFLSGVIVDMNKSDPFQARNRPYRIPDMLIDKLRDTGVTNLTPDDMTHLMQFASASCREIAQSIVNRRANAFTYPEFDMSPYEGRDWEIRRQGYEMRSKRDRELQARGEAPCNNQPLDFHSAEVRELLTPSWEDIKKSVDLEFQSLTNLQGGDEYKPYPMFLPTLPYRVWHVDYVSQADFPAVFGADIYCKLVKSKGVVY